MLSQSAPPLRVLLVEDDPGDVFLFREMLALAVQPAPEIDWAPSLQDGLARLAGGSFDVVFLDLCLPDSQGLSTYLDVAARQPGAPVVVLSGMNDVDLAVQAVQRGAQDYLRKGSVDGEHLYRAMRYAVERQRQKTELLQASVQSDHLAHHDALTGLPNRELGLDRLEQAIARAHRGQHKVAVLYVDLDHFKPINDSLGHAAGDRVLKTVAERLQSCVRETDTCARLGGDEFVVVLGEIRAQRAIAEVQSRILEALRAPIPWEGQFVSAGASIGLSIYPWDSLQSAQLIQCADQAMYRAKRQGGNVCCAYSSDVDHPAMTVTPPGPSLERALDRDELFLEYQPQVSCRSGEIIGVEALLRWQHPLFGRVGPTEFVAEAERAGLIGLITQWVLRTAGAELKAWHASSAQRPRLAINVSPCQIHQRSLLQVVQQVLRELGLTGSEISLELTSSCDVLDWDRARDTLQALKDLGVHIVIDDFGCGQGPFDYLVRLPIDAVKIDVGLVSQLLKSDTHAALAESVILLAHRLGKSVIAEGVESAAQLERLTALGCDAAQGYHLCPPIDAASLAAVLKRRSIDGADA